MKTRFSTLDLFAVAKDLKRKLLGLRVNQVYDIDNKTYLIRLQEKETKYVLLLESGIRVHTTTYEWPKQPAPSGFTMKLRKHIGNKRLESLEQLGVDRVLDFKFGSSEAAYHLIVELYDRGNILLTDYQYTIVNVLRPRREGEDVKFIVREVYQKDRVRQASSLLSKEKLKEVLKEAKPGSQLKKILVPHVEFGGALLEHCLLERGLPGNVALGKGFLVKSESQLQQLYSALELGDELYSRMLHDEQTHGYIIQKTEIRPKANASSAAAILQGRAPETEEVLTYLEFQPFLFAQAKDKPFLEFDNFDSAADEYFSKIESQKLDQKAFQQQKEAVKKLTNVRADQERRIAQLQETQELDRRKGELVQGNTELVDKALTVLQSAIASQMSWEAIEGTVQEAQAAGDFVACAIRSLCLSRSTFTMFLEDPYDDEREGMEVEISIDLTAYANARQYFEQKRFAAKKEQKTVESSSKAMKSAEKKTKQSLKEAAAVASINKARKVFWFEKFLWFISSENYLIIAGRDQQQNEMIVKRFLKSADVYVHADLHGASSVVVKNKGGGSTFQPIPPKTLNEAGVFAVCHSSAWDAKVVTSAWWVEAQQVSKTAPTGEYLTTGSFMIRGKKNYLPPCHLILGFGFMFKLEEDSIPRHKGERRIRGLAEDQEVDEGEREVDVEVPLEEDDEEEDSGDEKKNNPQSLIELVLEGEGRQPLDVIKEESAESVSVKPEEVASEEVSDCQAIEFAEKVKLSEANVDETTDCELKMDDGGAVVEVPEFPDTTINMEYKEGGEVVVRTQSVSLSSSAGGGGQAEEGEVYFLGDSQPVILSAGKRGNLAQTKRMEQAIQKGGDKKKGKKGKGNFYQQSGRGDGGVEKPLVDPKRDGEEEVEEEEDKKEGVGVGGGQVVKRGKKGKMKKIKEKYKDQDEEERALRMQLLASAGEARAKGKKKAGASGGDARKKLDPNPKKAVAVVPNVAMEGEDEIEENPEEELERVNQDELALNSLTGIPVPDDELMFAVPVVAPYSAMGNYKFRVKLTPGTGKRGKGAKTALNLFLTDKVTSSREKDLLRSVKDQDLARNIPGKVKLSAPHMQRGKKKK